MRKGKVYYREGDRVLEDTQKLLPNMVVKHVVVCKGTNRIQPLPAGCASRDAPLRYTVLVKRDGGEVELDDRVEDWSKLPRYKQMRPCTPAKMSLTAYGHALEQLRTFGEPSRRPMVESEPTEVPEDVEQLPSVEVLEQGHPPRSIPRHGPG